ncbi:MAG: alpha/beta fold hydrolase [Eggerthellaceae bacterium]|nr:alpha/beta fold hydrolase [Eggerthellaceae bacterium]
MAYAVHIYNDSVVAHLNSYKPLMLHVEDYEGLTCDDYTFESDKGQKLQGYMYSAGENQRGIIVLAHGYGKGHNSYMNCANYFAQHGYFVFAYDVTGTDKSEGVGAQNGIGGFPQSVIDLDYAISFVKESGNFPDLPIGLFGHSWGGYSVSSVLTFHPDVSSVIECSGCNTSSDLFKILGKSHAGEMVYAMEPFIKAYEHIKYGEYATNTALDGFANSDAPVMVVHGAADRVVPISYGYDLYYEQYKDDPRFSFIRFNNKGHNDFFYKDNNAYKKQLDHELKQWQESLSYDVTVPENKSQFSADKAAFLEENLDREQWAYRLDEELFAQFLTFYDEHMIA